MHSVRRTCSLNILQMTTLNVKPFKSFSIAYHTRMVYKHVLDICIKANKSSLINAFVVRCLDSIISLVSLSEISSLLLVSEAEQAG